MIFKVESQEFFRINNSGSSVLNSVIWMQFEFGDFSQMPKPNSLACFSACFSSS